MHGAVEVAVERGVVRRSGSPGCRRTRTALPDGAHASDAVARGLGLVGGDADLCPTRAFSRWTCPRWGGPRWRSNRSAAAALRGLAPVRGQRRNGQGRRHIFAGYLGGARASIRSAMPPASCRHGATPSPRLGAPCPGAGTAHSTSNSWSWARPRVATMRYCGSAWRRACSHSCRAGLGSGRKSASARFRRSWRRTAGAPCPCGVDTAIQVGRAHHGFHGIGQDGGPLGAAAERASPSTGASLGRPSPARAVQLASRTRWAHTRVRSPSLDAERPSKSRAGDRGPAPRRPETQPLVVVLARSCGGSAPQQQGLSNEAAQALLQGRQARGHRRNAPSDDPRT